MLQNACSVALCFLLESMRSPLDCLHTVSWVRIDVFTLLSGRRRGDCMTCDTCCAVSQGVPKLAPSLPSILGLKLLHAGAADRWGAKIRKCYSFWRDRAALFQPPVNACHNDTACFSRQLEVVGRGTISARRRPGGAAYFSCPCDWSKTDDSQSPRNYLHMCPGT